MAAILYGTLQLSPFFPSKAVAENTEKSPVRESQDAPENVKTLSFTFDESQPQSAITQKNSSKEPSFFLRTITQGYNGISLNFTDAVLPNQSFSHLIKITPSVGDVLFKTQGYSLVVFGEFKGNTEYSIEVSSDLLAVDNGQLKEEKASFTIKPLDPRLDTFPIFGFINIGQDGKIIPIRCWNYGAIELTAYPFEAKDLSISRYQDQELLVSRRTPIWHRSITGCTELDKLTILNAPIAEIKNSTFWLHIKGLKPLSPEPYDDHSSCFVRVERSDIELFAWTEVSKGICCMAHDISGKPISGAKVSLTTKELGSNVGTATTNKDGMACFKVQKLAAYPTSKFLVRASTHGSEAWEDIDLHNLSSQYQNSLIVDRQKYQPGQTINFKGWIRQVLAMPLKKLTVPPTPTTVQLKASDSSGNILYKEDKLLNEHGSFSGSFLIPNETTQGYISLGLTLLGGSSGSRLQKSVPVETRSSLPFLVSLSNSNPKHLILGQSTSLFSSSKYLDGLPNKNRRCIWTASVWPATYTPHGWNDFLFLPFDDSDYSNSLLSKECVTDEFGNSEIKIKTSGQIKRPLEIVIRNLFPDTETKTIGSTGKIIVHPSSICIGLRSSSENANSAKISAIVVDLDGHPKKDIRVTISLEKKEGLVNWKLVQQDVIVSTTTPSNVQFSELQQGTYRIIATAQDDNNHKTESCIVGENTATVFTPIPGGTVFITELNPSRISYTCGKPARPGQKARVSLMCPYKDGCGLLFQKNSYNGALCSYPFRIHNHQASIDVPVSEENSPFIRLDAHAFGSPDPQFFGQSRSNDLLLPVADDHKHLKVRIKTENTNQENEKTTLTLHVTNGERRRIANAEMGVLIMDSSGLDGDNNSNVEDPFIAMYKNENEYPSYLWDREYQTFEMDQAVKPHFSERTEPSGFSGANLFPPLWKATSERETTKTQQSTYLNGYIDGSRYKPHRPSFTFFAESITTNAKGEGTVSFKLPNYVTKYKVVVLAADAKDKFGMGEAEFNVLGSRTTEKNQHQKN